MFLQSNTEHIPTFAGEKNPKINTGRVEDKKGGGRHKGLSYFLCHLLASTFTAFSLHHVKDCKQATQTTTAHQRPHEGHVVLL